MTPAEVRRAIRNLLAERPRTVAETMAELNIDRQRVRSAFGVLSRWGKIRRVEGKRWEIRR